MFKVRPYKVGSRSAKALAEELGAKQLRLENSKYVPKAGHTIINWGNSSPFDNGLATLLNPPEFVGAVADKSRFFKWMRAQDCEDIIPPFWLNKEDIPDDESIYPIVCRTVLSGHSGDGIVIANSAADLVPCNLFVQYVKKSDEYRVHVGHLTDNAAELIENRVAVIAVQRKARRLSVPDNEVNWQVRNLSGGFVFVREGFTVPPAVLDAARRALEVSGLDFGAVDVIWNSYQERAYVLEINTAPGLEGQTVIDYVNFFKGVI
jgi:hypothetical protein